MRWDGGVTVGPQLLRLECFNREHQLKEGRPKVSWKKILFHWRLNLNKRCSSFLKKTVSQLFYNVVLTAAVQQSDSGVRTCIYNILFHYGLSQNIFKIIYLFIFGHAGSLWLCRVSLVAVSGGYSLAVVPSFSLQWLLLWNTGSRAGASVVGARRLSSCGSRAPEHRLDSCGPWTWFEAWYPRPS